MVLVLVLLLVPLVLPVLVVLVVLPVPVLVVLVLALAADLLVRLLVAVALAAELLVADDLLVEHGGLGVELLRRDLSGALWLEGVVLREEGPRLVLGLSVGLAHVLVELGLDLVAHVLVGLDHELQVEELAAVDPDSSPLAPTTYYYYM